MEFENIPKDTEEINEFFISFILKGLGASIAKINKYTVILAGLLIGLALYAFKKITVAIFNHIRQSKFESNTKELFIDHLYIMDQFLDSCEKLGIEKSGLVTLDNINLDTLKCIKNKDHIEALTCTITIFKESHFYLMDLFLQTIYFNSYNLNNIKRISQLRSHDTGDENINSFISSYYGMIKNYFKLIIKLKNINKKFVINPYNIEQEFNQKLVELVKYYQDITDNANK